MVKIRTVAFLSCLLASQAQPATAAAGTADPLTPSHGLWQPAFTPEQLKAAFPAKGDVGKAEHRSFDYQGVTRSYLIQTPDDSDAEKMPLVILLHGGAGSGAQAWAQTSLPTLAAGDKFIIVAPDAVGKHWNDGRGSTLSGDPPSTADDVGFLHALIGYLIAHDHADPHAVFMAGASNGGFMTMHYACAHAGDLRAAAYALAELTYAEAATCHPPAPIPWLAMNGVDDPLVPFEGQATAALRLGAMQPALLSADTTFTRWADSAGCAAAVQSEKLPRRNPNNPAWVERRTRTGCVGSTSSVYYVLHGSGHAWPGIREVFLSHLLGGSSQDIDAGSALWAFFKGTMGK